MKNTCNRCKLRTSWGSGCAINIKVKRKRSLKGVIIDQRPLENCPKPLTAKDAKFFLNQEERVFVYCLYKSDVPFYVGITNNIAYRLRSHQKVKDFDYAYYIQCQSRIDATMIENAFIGLMPSLSNIRGQASINGASSFNVEKYKT